MEILAPAGSIPMLKTAVAHGADAVYLGLNSFSARAKATDFTAQNLALYVAYCHKFGVKVYITLNTLVKESEMREALRCAETAYSAGVDAALVQDLGFAALLCRNLPNLALHASTQLGVHNLEGAEYVRSLGFRRVVLARETPFPEIARIAGLGIETEVFVHGALCVSFSGNCYYSSLVSGNSGNRGRCLQLCRKEYCADCGSGTKSGRLLSPADLSLASRLGELEAMGVTSLKIEGRMKRPEYAGIVVDAYRKALRGETLQTEDEERLLTVFARGGFCEGYARGASSAKDFVGKGVAGHLGLKIGKVSAVTPNSVEVETRRSLDPADGFKSVRDGAEVGGASHAKLISAGRYRLSKMGDAQIGDQVFITTDARSLAAAAAVERKIPLRIEVDLRVGQPARVCVSDGNHRVETRGEIVEQARSAPLGSADIESVFSKLGGTDYSADVVCVRADRVFMPKSRLNELRRSVIAKLEDSYVSTKYMPKTDTMRDITRNICLKRPHRLYARAKECALVPLSADAVVYAPEDYRRLPIPCRDETYLELPVIAFAEDVAVLEAELETLRAYRGVVANNVWGLEFARKHGLPVVAGFGLNVANPYWDETFDDAFVSPEFGAAGFGAAFGFGEFPLMTFAHCPYRVATQKGCDACACDGTLTYRDDRGKIMPIRRMRLARCYFTMNDVLELPAERRTGRMLVNTIGVAENAVQAFLRGEKVLPRANYFENVK